MHLSLYNFLILISERLDPGDRTKGEFSLPKEKYHAANERPVDPPEERMLLDFIGTII